MGKKSQPSQPTPPDPYATATAQAAADKETAITQGQLNQVNQVGPYGNLSYTQRGTTPEGTPQYTATTTLSPDGQRQLDLTNRAGITYGETANNQLDQLSQLLSQPLDFDSLGSAPVANEETRQSVRDSTISRLQPTIDRDRAAMESSLASQGINLGSEAYEDATRQFDNRLNDMYLATDAQAGNEMARMYGLESNVRDRAINELIQQRQLPLNETLALLSGTQVQSPQFVNTPQASLPSPPVAESIYNSYQGELNNYNQRSATASANTQGLYSLLGAGASAFAFSDRRLKENIVKVGQLASGLGIYLFRYVWGGPVQLGLMSDEVRRVRPSAVVTVGGFDAVNYEEALS